MCKFRGFAVGDSHANITTAATNASADFGSTSSPFAGVDVNSGEGDPPNRRPDKRRKIRLFSTILIFGLHTNRILELPDDRPAPLTPSKRRRAAMLPYYRYLRRLYTRKDKLGGGAGALVLYEKPPSITRCAIYASSSRASDKGCVPISYFFQYYRILIAY